MSDPTQHPDPQVPPPSTDETLVEEAISAVLATAIRAHGWGLKADLTQAASGLMVIRAELDAARAHAAAAHDARDDD